MPSPRLLGILIPALFVSVPLMAAPPVEGLIAHYPLNELPGGDKVQDVSGNEHLAFADSIEVVDGLGGKVFAFDGEKSLITLPEESVFEITGDYSVSFWMRVEADSTYVGPIYAQPGFRISSFKGSLRATFRNPEYSKTGFRDLMGPQINDGEWHHVVFTYSGKTGEAVLFLDGEEVERTEFAHKPDVSMPTTVGGFGRIFYRGELSDLRVYSRFLDAVDVAGLKDAKTNP